jgi:hypothetical protein
MLTYEVLHMPIPLLPVVGLPSNLMLLKLTTVFTPLLGGLALLSGLCGLGIGMLLACGDTSRTTSPTMSSSKSPAFPKAA